MRFFVKTIAIALAATLLLASLSFNPRAQAQTPAPSPTPPTPQQQQQPTPTPTPQSTEAAKPGDAPGDAQDDDVERVETNLVNVLFNAADKNRRFITTLRQEDVQIFEDDVPQSISDFQRATDLPLSLAILVDVSGSQENTLPDEKEAAHAFIDSVMRPERDRAAVVSFMGYATIEQDMTGDRASLHRAVESLFVAPPPPRPSATATPVSDAPVASGDDAYDPREARSTAIWDAIWATCRDMLANTPTGTRRAIILLSDGKEDSNSPLKKQDAIDAAIQADASIYSIGIGDYEFDEGALKKISERTGGRAFFPEDEAQLNAAFAQIEQELRTQYLLAYSPANKARDNTFRRLRLELVNPELRKEKLKLTYRNGYFARPPRAAAATRERPAKARLPKPPKPVKKR
ncbi:MAG TPA: VWA domain-containing protein [Pyrinomonadaceae bacterium]|jgi:VWFA-related protein|nr:VWA domain-containing protein [Pyrinomonadaceae bacterium]